MCFTFVWAYKVGIYKDKNIELIIEILSSTAVIYKKNGVILLSRYNSVGSIIEITYMMFFKSYSEGLPTKSLAFS